MERRKAGEEELARCAGRQLECPIPHKGRRCPRERSRPPLVASSSIGSAVAAFKYGAGRISALASAPASSPAALTAGLAGVGDNLELAGLNESSDGRVFGRPCADLAFFARAQEKPLPARKRNVQWFLRRVLDRRQSRVSPLNCVHPQLDRGAPIVATRWADSLKHGRVSSFELPVAIEARRLRAHRFSQRITRRGCPVWRRSRGCSQSKSSESMIDGTPKAKWSSCVEPADQAIRRSRSSGCSA